MPPKSKPFSDLGHERQRILTKTVSDIPEQHCPSLDEAHLLLNKVFSRCQSVLPGLSGVSGKCGQLVTSLGDLRASVAEDFGLSRITSPSVSVADLDRARALTKNVVSFVICELLPVVLLHHFFLFFHVFIVHCLILPITTSILACKSCRA